MGSGGEPPVDSVKSVVAAQGRVGSGMWPGNSVRGRSGRPIGSVMAGRSGLTHLECHNCYTTSRSVVPKFDSDPGMWDVNGERFEFIDADWGRHRGLFL